MLRLAIPKPPFSIRLTKRKEFVIITIFLTILLLLTQLISKQYRYWALVVLYICTYITSALGLRENMKGINWIMLLIVPTFFTVFIGLFYFLFPVRWLTRIPVSLFYAVGIYAILLVENIYSVALERSIQLIRVARTIGFLISLATLFFMFNTLYSLHYASWINMLLVFIGSFPIVLQFLWAVNLQKYIEKKTWIYAVCISFVLSEAGFMISFWPLKPIIISVFLTTYAYALMGIVSQHILRRLFRKTITEYIQVMVVVTIMILLTTTYR